MRTVDRAPPVAGAPALDVRAPPATPVVNAAVVGSSAVLAALVVARHLGTKPLWRDEAISVSVAGRPLLRILSVLPHHDANAGLYYVVLHLWLRLGPSATWARGFSALCFAATAAVVAWAGCRWRGWALGLACGLLAATNPFLAYYGQEARPYALAAGLAALSTIALFWHRDGPAPRWYVALTIALIYTDLFAVLFVAAMAGAVSVVLRRRGQPVPLVLIRTWAVIAAVSAPLAAVMVIGERGQISWLGRPTAHDLIWTVTAMSAGWLGLALIVALGVVATVTVSRSARADRRQLAVAALAAAFVVPPPALWTVAQIVPCFIDRYVICSAVAMVGLAGAGLSALRAWAGRIAAAVVLAALVLLGAQRIATVEAGPYKVDNAPAVIDFITSHAQAGDAIGYAGGGLRILINESRPAVHDPAPAHPAPLFPADVALAPGGEEFFQHDLYAREVSPPVLAQRLAGIQRLWLLTDPRDLGYPQGGPFSVLRPGVTSEFTPATAISFGAVDVTLLVRR